MFFELCCAHFVQAEEQTHIISSLLEGHCRQQKKAVIPGRMYDSNFQMFVKDLCTLPCIPDTAL